MKCNVTIDGVTWKNVNIDYYMFRDLDQPIFKISSGISITPVDEPITKNDEMILKRIKEHIIQNGRWVL